MGNCLTYAGFSLLGRRRLGTAEERPMSLLPRDTASCGRTSTCRSCSFCSPARCFWPSMASSMTLNFSSDGRVLIRRLVFHCQQFSQCDHIVCRGRNMLTQQLLVSDDDFLGCLVHQANVRLALSLDVIRARRADTTLQYPLSKVDAVPALRLCLIFALTIRML